MTIKFNPNPTESDSEREYYVCVVDYSGDNYRLALGPYDTIAEALDNVELGRCLVFNHYPKDACWYGYGTCSVPRGTIAKVVFTQEQADKLRPCKL